MKSNYRLIKKVLIFIVVAMLIFLIGPSLSFFEEKYEVDYTYLEIDKWNVYVNGVKVREQIGLPYRVVENMKNNEITITSEIPIRNIDSPYLLVRVSQQTISVKVNNQLIYKFDSMIKIRNKSSGASWRLIELPKDCYGKQVSITFNSSYEETVGIINKVYFGDKNEHILILIEKSILSLVVGSTLIILSVFVMVLYICIRYKYSTDMKEYFYLAIFLFMLAIIVLVESRGMTLLINNFALYYYCEFIALYAIPIYFYGYVYYSYELEHKEIIKKLMYFHYLVFTLGLIGESTGLYDFFQGQFRFFIIFIITLSICLFISIKELSKNKTIIRFIMTNIMVIVILIIDIVLFYIRRERIGGSILLTAIIIVEMALSISIFNKVISYFKSNMENKYLHNQIRSNLYYYRTIKKTTDKFKNLRHDMKNHFIAISYLLEDNKVKEAKEYIGQLNQYIAESNEIINTGNYILDAIVTEKKKQAVKEDIEFITKINIQPDMKVDAMDWCIIFGNILDNALEACNKVEGTEKKIEVELKIKGNMFIIKISNSYNGVLINNRGYYETLKLDKEYHGIGIKNIKEAINRYDGIYKIEANENTFTFSIILNDVCK